MGAENGSGLADITKSSRHRKHEGRSRIELYVGATAVQRCGQYIVRVVDEAGDGDQTGVI